MKKIILFSAGENTRCFLKKKYDINVVAIVDNDSDKWGLEIDGYEIFCPAIIREKEVDYIVITTIYEKEIRKQLIEKFHIPKDKILSGKQFEKKEYVNEKYRRRYANKNTSNYAIRNKSIVVYTGIFGKYDTLKEPDMIEDGIEYVCFTDNKNLHSNTWKIRYIEKCTEIAPIKVRYYKCNPHILFPEFDLSIWIDANLQIKKSMREYISNYMGNTGILFMPHEYRDCIYREAAMNIILEKTDCKTIINQVSTYMKAGYPENNGLYWGGFIVREHNRSEIIKCMEDWYKEITTYSFRDQISLPYVLWKNRIEPDLANEVPYETNLLNYYRHLV